MIRLHPLSVSCGVIISKMTSKVLRAHLSSVSKHKVSLFEADVFKKVLNKSYINK